MPKDLSDKPTENGGAEESELLRLIFESATDFAIFTMDPRGLTTSWNPGAERVIGFKEKDILGRPADVIFPPEEPHAAEEERRDALLHGRAEDERWQLRQDGSRFWASGLLMPLSDRDRGFVKILRDRTAQHLAEERVKSSERSFRALLTNIPQLVFRSRADGHLTWSSPNWESYCGLSVQSTLGLGWLDAIHPADRQLALEAWAKAAQERRMYCELRLLKGEGAEHRWHQCRALPTAEDDLGAAEWIGTLTDIHDLRSLEGQQSVLLDELEHRTQNLLGLLSSIAVQTIRTGGSLESIEQDLSGRIRALSRTLGRIASSSEQSLDLQALLDAEFEPFLTPGFHDISIHGPKILLPPRAAQSLALVLHELTTNAAKYGVLAQGRGKLSVK